MNQHQASHLPRPAKPINITPWNQPTFLNQTIQDYLFAPATYTPLALIDGLNDPIQIELWQRLDAVDLQLRIAMAYQQPRWHWLDREIWAFLAYHHPAARDLIPQALATIKQAILSREWYELGPYYEGVHRHTQHILSIQRSPRQNPPTR
jgi:hypothetical protein